MEELVGAISQVGFPIAISIYLLVRFEQKMEKLAQVILDQIGIIKEQKDKIAELREIIVELKDCIKESK